jgi:uncharacterized protein (DUF2141 family)
MKQLFLSIAITLTSFLGFCQETEGRKITVTIDNIKNNSGHVLLGLHTKEDFMKGPGIQSQKCEIKNGKITVTFANVKPGIYAVLALHDSNDNERMDFEIGMPLESYGMSNNQMSYGPPQFSEAKFEMVGKNVEMTIRF